MDITQQVTLAVLAFAAATMGEVSFSVKDCAHHKNTELLTIPEAHVSPDPVGIPGDLAVTGTVQINREAGGDVSLEVTIERYVGFFWLTVPCVSGVGSCTYKDTCQLLNYYFGNGTYGCPQQLIDNNAPCLCPIPEGTYNIHSAVFTIPELGGLWTFLAEGDYQVTGKLVDNPTGEEIACQQVKFTIVDGHAACDGLFCNLIG